MKHLFIINPIAGGRNKKHLEETLADIEAFSKQCDAPVEVYYTKAPMDACRKITEESELLTRSPSPEKEESKQIELYVYAYGGDGTLNECVNGAALRKNVAVTSYPSGTGNDFLKTFTAENIDCFRNLEAISQGSVRKLDIIKCAAYTGSGEEMMRYGINICSVGIDARVGTDVHKYTKIPLVGKSMGYNISLVVNVIKGITRKFRIAAGDNVFDGKYTLACVCNGRYYGGGFNPVPDALPDDGVLDCLVVEPVSRLQVAKIVGRFAQGRFAEFPDIFNFIRCTSVEIEADNEFVINIDGEAMHASKIRFDLIPHGVNFLFPSGL